MKKLLLSLFLAMTGGVLAQNAPLQWGDQGNGTYINPILNADFSDPDVIRVDSMYYMVASDFHFMGMQVLESNDMVNWRYVAQIYDRFDEPGWDENAHYAGGSWALHELGSKTGGTMAAAPPGEEGAQMGGPLSAVGRRRTGLPGTEPAWRGAYHRA